MPLGLLDLSIVTDRLTDLLTSALAQSTLWVENTAPGNTQPAATPPFTIHVNGDAPDVIKEGSDTQLSMFLFHVTPDKFQRNSPVTGGSVPPIPMQPMSLDLYYLLSAHSVSGYVQEQQAISVALKCFHENPIVRATVPVDGRLEEFCLTVEVQGWDELSRFWQATTSPVRLSVMYKVSVVFVEPPAPPVPQIVTSFILNVDVPTIAFSELGILATTFAKVNFTWPSGTPAFPDGQPKSYNVSPARVSAGANFQVFGTDLRRANYSDQFYITPAGGGTETEITSWLNTSLSTKSTLDLTVPAVTTPPAPPAVVPAAGVYLLTVGHDFPASTSTNPQPPAIRSNGIPISISALVLPTGGPSLTAAAGVYTVAGSGFVSGSTTVLLNSIALAETTGALGAGLFLIGASGFQFMPPTALPSGTYLVRVQVAQVESAPAVWITV